jgi:hypothetical protein
VKAGEPLFHASLSTRHFRFDAYAKSRAAAFDAMKRGWRAHQKQTGAEATWAEVKVDVIISEVSVDHCYRYGDEGALA